ncbi:hypothetical protein M9Y10_015518 [Tritrichomonas musculus]|uniref:Uncharacterized protein n=1 Tax=Tritrichomonas musculus TaxID=1915356 RepID=A0ABR2L5Q1_9EUKA
MSDLESLKTTKEEIIEKRMKDMVTRMNHLNEQKKENKKKTRNYWKNNYNKRGRNGHKEEDKKISLERKEKEMEQNENQFFIFIKETKKPVKNSKKAKD